MRCATAVAVLAVTSCLLAQPKGESPGPAMVLVTPDAPTSLANHVRAFNKARADNYARLSKAHADAVEDYAIIEAAKVTPGRGVSAAFNPGATQKPGGISLPQRPNVSTKYNSQNDRTASLRAAAARVQAFKQSLAALQKYPSDLQFRDLSTQLPAQFKGQIATAAQPGVKVLEVLDRGSFLGAVTVYKSLNRLDGDRAQVVRAAVIQMDTTDLKPNETISIKYPFEIVEASDKTDDTPPVLKPIDLGKYIKKD